MVVARGAWLSLKLTHSSEILDPGFLSCTSYEKNTLIRHVQFTREKNYSREEPQNVHLGFFPSQAMQKVDNQNVRPFLRQEDKIYQ